MKPTVPEVLPAVRELYRDHAVGCCLHVVLDDCNVSDADVEWCRQYAQKRGHARCEALAGQLALMSQTQRRKLASQH